MSLFGFSRELLFKVSNQRQSHASPQSARKGEHFYRGEGKMGEMLNSVHFFSLAESLPGKERSQKSLFFLLGAAVVILSIKVIRGFLLGTTWDLHSVVVMTALCLGDFALFRASLTLSASQGGVVSRSSPHFPEAILRGYVAGSQLYNQEMEKSRL